MKRFSLLLVVLVSMFFVTTAFSQGMGFNALGVGAGIVMPEDPWDMGFNGGVYANLGEVADNLALVPSVTYWSSGYTFTFIEDVDLTLSNISIGADVHYFFQGKGEGVYAGGGLNFNFLSIDIPNPFTGESLSETDTKIGFAVLGGYNANLGGTLGFIEAKYNIITDLSTFQINAGVWFDM